MASANGGAMENLQSHIEDMRSLTNCKICLKPFYEPYILICGHTYCYSCLRSWFLGRSVDGAPNNKNCPDCRATVFIQPAPNYAMRDLTHMFVRRAELIAEDETVQGHVKDMQEEAETLNKDKTGKGLFNGIFKSRLPHFGDFMRPLPIADLENNIDLCPICTWEIVDGICAGCGFDVNDPNNLNMSDFDDLDDSEDDDSDDESIRSMPVGAGRPRSQVRSFNIPQIDSDEEEDSDVDPSEVDQYDVHDDFIDDEDEDDVDDMDNAIDIDTHSHGPYEDDISVSLTQSSHGTTVQDGLHSFHRPQDASSEIGINQSDDAESSSDVTTNYDESEEEPDFPVQRLRPGRTMAEHPRRRPVVISDDEDEEEEETYHNAHETTMTSDDESEASADSSEASPEISDENEEESDDTAIPPQPGRSRHERLATHRARRPDKNASRVGRGSVETASRLQPNRSEQIRSFRSNGRRTGTTTRVY